MNKPKKRFGTSRKFPKWKSAVLLGTVKKISIYIKDELFDFSWRKKPMLLSSDGGSQLLILVGVKSKADKSVSSDAENLWEAWSGFEVGSVEKIKVKTPLLHKLGRAKEIVYTSDKKSGKKRDWIHEFENPPIVWVDKKTDPETVLLTGGRLAVKGEGITG